MLNQDYFKKLSALECQDATYHPKANPVVIAKANGSYVWDVEGRKYLDFCAGFGSLALGHNPPEFKRVLQGVLDNGITQGFGDVYATRSKVELFEELHKVLPPYLNKSCLSVTGGQAVEYAIKTAFLYQKTHQLAVVEGAYHGLDFGALSTTQNKYFREGFEPWLQESQVHSIEYSPNEDEFCENLSQTLSGVPGIAAFLLEPIQGRAGTRKFSTTCLQKVREICSQHNVLLVFDEILVGLGRTGRMSFCEEVEADISCFGKALGAGMPISVCAARSEVMDAWRKCEGEAKHTGTFFGHPMSCAVAVMSLQQIVKQELAAQSVEKGRDIQTKLSSALDGCESFVECRGVGLMQVIQGSTPGFGARVMDKALDLGLIVIPSAPDGSCVSLTPALNIDSDALDEGLESIIDIIKTFG